MGAEAERKLADVCDLFFCCCLIKILFQRPSGGSRDSVVFGSSASGVKGGKSMKMCLNLCVEQRFSKLECGLYFRRGV